MNTVHNEHNLTQLSRCASESLLLIFCPFLTKDTYTLTHSTYTLHTVYHHHIFSLFTYITHSRTQHTNVHLQSYTSLSPSTMQFTTTHTRLLHVTSPSENTYDKTTWTNKSLVYGSALVYRPFGVYIRRTPAWCGLAYISYFITEKFF